jgi:ureidoglycolate lyase
MQIRILAPVRATATNLIEYGELIDIPRNAEALPVAFYEGSVRVFSPVTFISDDDSQLTLASIDARPFKVKWLERHFKHTQTFIPLSGKPFVMVLSEPTATDMPNLDNAKAFLFDGSAGFVLHIGTWHEFPFALADDTRLVVILRKEATNALMKDVVIEGEGHSGDLDKKDIQSRLKIELWVDL